ncbi:MAG TPA: hypothetical protein VFO55_10040 [Gemmatimonadaceae bacterium]|nr:hypothetical protein [Gemmatimonadaceae bacterium]
MTNITRVIETSLIPGTDGSVAAMHQGSRSSSDHVERVAFPGGDARASTPSSSLRCQVGHHIFAINSTFVSNEGIRVILLRRCVNPTCASAAAMPSCAARQVAASIDNFDHHHHLTRLRAFDH